MRAAMMVMKRGLIGQAAVPALLGALALSGCVNLGGGKAPDMLIRLTSEDSLPAGAAPHSAGNAPILVVEPATDRSLAVTRVAVQVDATRLAYLSDVAWVEPPARLFSGLLAEALRVKGAGVVLEGDQYAPHDARRLSGRLLAMGYDVGSRSVVVRFDAIAQAGDGSLVARRFEAVEPHVSPYASAVAPALNRAANDVARQVAAWVVG